MIQVKDLYFSYSQSESFALRGVDLTLQQGEWLALIGCNGSGKSTLARHFNGLLLPSSGYVRVDGLDTADPGQLWQIRSKVSFVFQNPDNQFIAASVEDDIAFGLENLGIPREEISLRVENALAALELGKLRNKEPHLLSGGEKQRVAIAGALAMSCDYLVLDEPTSMLDPQMRSSLLAALSKIHKEKGLGILYVTNIMEEALLADRVAVMESGNVIREGTPKEIFCDRDFVSRHGLELPPARQIAAMLADAGYREFADAVTEQELMELVLCAG